MSSTCKTIFYTKLVKTKTAPFTNPFHLTHYYNDHLPYKELLARPKKFNSYSYFDLEVQHTHTQKKYVDDYHTASSIFHQLKKSLPLAEIALENRPRVILKTQLSNKKKPAYLFLYKASLTRITK